MEEVFEIADKLEVLRDGRYIDTVDARNTDRDRIISMMVGREIKDLLHISPTLEQLLHEKASD